MPVVTLRPSRLVALLAFCALCGRTSAAALPDRAAPFLFRREAADAHGLTGGQIVIIASVAILGVVALVVAGIVGCYLCAKIEYADRQQRREMQEEQGLVSAPLANYMPPLSRVLLHRARLQREGERG